MRISDWSSDVCSSDLDNRVERRVRRIRLGKAGESEAVPELSVEVLRGHRIATATAGMVHPGAEHTAVGLHHELGGRNRAPPLALDRRIDLRLDLAGERSEEHTSELQSLMRISYAVFCLKKKIIMQHNTGT